MSLYHAGAVRPITCVSSDEEVRSERGECALVDHRPERVTALECQWMTTLSGRPQRATALRERRPRVHWTHRRIVPGPVACTVLYMHTYVCTVHTERIVAPFGGETSAGALD